MSRRGAAKEGSLDLLLDTICNTFGGVLFISMLVVILLNIAGEDESKEPPEPSQQVKLVEAKVELDEKLQEMERLEAAVQSLAFAADETEEQRLKGLLGRLQAAETARVVSARQRAELTKALAAMQSTTNDVLTATKELEVKRAAAAQALLSIQQKLAEEKQHRTKSIRPKPARKTTKLEVPTFLTGGRFIAIGQPNAAGALSIDRTACSEKTDANGKYIEARASAGLAVQPEGKNLAIRALVGRFDKHKHYIAVFVWPDSFEAFSAIKDILLEDGFEYRLVPMPVGEKVYTGGGSAGGGEVQGG